MENRLEESPHDVFFDQEDIVGKIINTLNLDVKFVKGYSGEVCGSEIQKIEKTPVSVVAAIEVIVDFKPKMIIGSDEKFLETPSNKSKFDFYEKVVGKLLSKIHDNKIRFLFGYLKALVPNPEGNGAGEKKFSEKINIMSVSR